MAAVGDGALAVGVWCLAVALMLGGSQAFPQDRVTWPGCTTSYPSVERGKLNNSVIDLYLGGCNLTSINIDHLRCYPNLDTLIFSNNKISQIDAELFSSFPKLTYLNLETNSFLGKNLPANLFKNWHPSGAVTLSLNNNNMQNTPTDLLVGLNVNGLYLNNCSLLEFPSFAKRPLFPRMFALMLENNLISRLDDPRTFSNNVNLDMLYLYNNHIDFLHPDLLKPLLRISSFRINNNRIKCVPDGFFHGKTSLTTVTLKDNLIEYLPLDTFKDTGLKFLSISGNRLTHLPVNFLPELQRGGVSLKVFYFDRNPWNFSNLNKNFIEVKKQSIIYHGSHHEYTYALAEDSDIDDDGQHLVC